MEFIGGFMVMLSILGFFLTVIWFILPFVVFAMKGKQDRTYELLEAIDRRLAEIEKQLSPPATVSVASVQPAASPDSQASESPPSSAAD